VRGNYGRRNDISDEQGRDPLPDGDAGACVPYGLKALDLLKRRGFAVNDRWLTTREEVDAFKAEHGVKTTPQTFIGSRRVGGYDDLRRHFGKRVRDPAAVTYRPVVAVFAVAAVMALATSWAASGALLTVGAAEWFIAFSMCILASSAAGNREYLDMSSTSICSPPVVPYSYVYPFAERSPAADGPGALMWLVDPDRLVHRHDRGRVVFKAVISRSAR
jgi:glutaredoxin